MTECVANEKLANRHNSYFTRYPNHITKYAAVIKRSLDDSVQDDYVIELGIKGIGIEVIDKAAFKHGVVNRNLAFSKDIINDIYVEKDTYIELVEDITYMQYPPLSETNEEFSKLTGGISICNKHYSTIKGTLGALFKTVKDHEIYFLTNQHIALGDINDTISHVYIENCLKKYRDIGVIYWKEDCKNGLLDAAIIKIMDCSVDIGRYDRSKNLKFKGLGFPKIGDNVRKCGRSSEVTFGEIRSVNCTVNINNNLGSVDTFKNQIMTTSMIIGGDSGSVLVNDNDEIVGLFFAGNYMGSYANNINDIFSKVNNHNKDFLLKKFV